MNTIIVVIMLSSWHLHRHAQLPPVEVPPTIEQQREDYAQALGGCSYQDGIYFFSGKDKEIGMSDKSCGEAYEDWRHRNTPAVVMSRV